MMYTETVPWHGLGTYVGDTPLLSEEAIVKAGLDWEVEASPLLALRYDEGTDTDHECTTDEYVANVRASDNKILGVVQNRYSIIQNSEAFAFLDHAAGPGKLLRYHTAGSLYGGKRVWMLAEVTGLVIEPVKNDITQPYLLLVNGHDGRMPLKAMFTSVRVVCQNTLNMALKSAKDGITIRHTGSLKDKLAAATTILGLTRHEIEVHAELSKTLAQKKMGDKVFKQFLEQLIPVNEEKPSTRRTNVRDKITELYHSGAGTEIPGVRGTAWGALQAVTEYNSHWRGTRKATTDLEKRSKRLTSAWMGSGNEMNRQALSLLADA